MMANTTMPFLLTLLLLLLVAYSDYATGNQIETDVYPTLRQFFTVNLDEESRAINNPNTTMQYLLFTKANPNTAQELKVGNVPSVINSNFNPSWPVKLFHNGWSGNCQNDKTSFSLRNDYLKRGNYNYIDVWWQCVPGTEADTYTGIRAAGKNTAQLIKFLIDVTGVPLNSFHVIGLSAGAHAAGSVGFNFNELFNYKLQLPRITGLDPSSYWKPDSLSKDDYLEASDAHFVDIIHTDGTPVVRGAGIQQQIGHADFYPNNGCCNHVISFSYFQESITTTTGFFALRCTSFSEYTSGQCFGEDVQLMGEDVFNNASGIYFLSVNEVSPYAQGPGPIGVAKP